MNEHAHPSPHRTPGAPEDFVLEFLGLLKPRAEVLDVACGTGRHALAFARAGCRVTALDRSGEALAVLRDAADRDQLPVRTVQADVEAMSLVPASVDGIVNVCFLYRPLFDEYVRALRPGGYLYFRTFTSDHMDVLGHSRPSRRFLLRKGELRDAFRALDTVYHSEVVDDVGDGRAMATLVASRSAL